MRFQKAMTEALEKRLKSPSTEDKLPGALRQLRESNAGTSAPPSLATTTIKQQGIRYIYMELHGG